MQDGQKRMATLRVDRRGPVTVLWLEHPPVNALSRALRAELVAALEAARVDDLVQAVVIAATGAQFSAGADITELAAGTGAGPDLGGLCLKIEEFCKPVVVALQAAALGGGLELALAAHLRVALVSARVGLPEVKLGLLPGAGGTQRLPRLIGAAPALRLMQSGEMLGAPQAQALGLIDVVVEDQVVDAAVQAAIGLIGTDWARLRSAVRVVGMRDPLAYQQALAAARTGLGHAPAVGRIADCVEAAQLLPFAQGLAFEQAAFMDLLASPEAQGLRHAFFAERRAQTPPKALALVAAPTLVSVAIWGARDDAADLALQALSAGLWVTIVETERPVLVTALERLAARQQLAVTEGRMTADARDADWARLAPTLEAERLQGADLLLAMASAGPVPEVAAALPQIVVGAVLSGPAPSGVGLQPGNAAGHVAELSAWPDAPLELQALGLAFARRLGWRVVFAGGAGQIERRLLAALVAAIAMQQQSGVARPVITAALSSFGFSVRPQEALPPLPPGGDEILSYCLAAMANEGGRMVSEGVAFRPLDVDAVAVMSGAYPRWQGGPMLWAEQRGALVLRAELQRRAVWAPELFTPAPFFDWIITEGKSFAEVNRG